MAQSVVPSVLNKGEIWRQTCIQAEHHVKTKAEPGSDASTGQGIRTTSKASETRGRAWRALRAPERADPALSSVRYVSII